MKKRKKVRDRDWHVCFGRYCVPLLLVLSLCRASPRRTEPFVIVCPVSSTILYVSGIPSIVYTLIKLFQYVERPPVASKQKPVVKLHGLLATKRMRLVISSSVPVRFIGILSVMYLT